MKLYGVFVGIDKYEDNKIQNLSFAVEDARRFHQLILDTVDPHETVTFLLIDEEATRSKIMHTVGVKIANLAKQDDIVMIHFACHGSPEIGNRISEANRYLIPYDAKYQNIFGTGINLEKDLVELLERIAAKLIIVFVDSCFSGAAGGRTFIGPNLHQAKRKFRSLITLSNINLGEGRIIISASDDDQPALEDSSLRHGIFSFALIDALSNNSSTEPSVTITSLYDEVSRKVLELSGGNQQPILNGRSKMARIPRFVK